MVLYGEFVRFELEKNQIGIMEVIFLNQSVPCDWTFYYGSLAFYCSFLHASETPSLTEAGSSLMDAGEANN